MKLLQILNEIEVINTMSYKIEVDGKIILVAPEDLGRMNWYEATEACKKLGPKWRLPTLEELKAMYEQLHREGKGNFKKKGKGNFKKKGKGNFKDDWYWSSSQNGSSYAWMVSFGGGNTYSADKFYLGQVRPVRSPNPTI